MLPSGFEPTVLVDERPQTYIEDSAATGTGNTDYDRPETNYRIWNI